MIIKDILCLPQSVERFEVARIAARGGNFRQRHNGLPLELWVFQRFFEGTNRRRCRQPDLPQGLGGNLPDPRVLVFQRFYECINRRRGRRPDRTQGLSDSPPDPRV
jgi:hypothetical protein